MSKSSPEFEIYQDKRKEWRWRIRAANNKVICVSSEGYKNRADADHSIAIVKEAGVFPVIDK